MTGREQRPAAPEAKAPEAPEALETAPEALETTQEALEATQQVLETSQQDLEASQQALDRAEDAAGEAEDAAEEEAGWPPEPQELSLTWQNRPATLLKAAQAVDIVQKAGRRWKFHLGIIILLVVFFLPDLRFDTLPHILGGVGLLALAVAAGMLAKYGPDRANRKFSQQKAAAAPTARITLTRYGFSIREGAYTGTVNFAQDPKCAAAELEGVVALSYERNRVSAIPLADLNQQERDQLRELLRLGLGDRFHRLGYQK